MAIIGAILGDIAGSKWEFNRPKDLDYEHIELFQDDSYYTDDTVLSVATKYSKKAIHRSSRYEWIL